MMNEYLLFLFINYKILILYFSYINTGPSVPGQGNYRPSGQVFPSQHGAPQGYHGYPPNQQGQPPPGQVIIEVQNY